MAERLTFAEWRRRNPFAPAFGYSAYLRASRLTLVRGGAGRPVRPGQPRPDVPLGWVEFVCGAPDLRLLVLMGEDAPTITGGYGGWQEVERPQRLALTQWRGGSPLRLTIPVVFDGFADREPVEDQVHDLERMTRRLSGEATAPIIRVGGAVPHPNYEWVVETLAWGASLRRRDGKRTRQAVSVVLMQYVEDTLVVERAAKRMRRRRGKRSTVVVHKGENLRDVAKRIKVEVKALAKANDIRDPKKVIQRGRILKLP